MISIRTIDKGRKENRQGSNNFDKLIVEFINEAKTPTFLWLKLLQCEDLDCWLKKNKTFETSFGLSMIKMIICSPAGKKEGKIEKGRIKRQQRWRNCRKPGEERLV